MEDLHGGFARRSGGEMVAFGGADAEEFQEDEIWAVREASSSHRTAKPKKGLSSSPPWCFAATAPRPIPRPAGVQDEQGYSSAPVNIPVWSNMLKQPKKKTLWEDLDDGDGCRRTSHDHHVKDDDDDDGMFPPHEYLARSRKHVNGKNVSFSMCEGVGGTLKGRDLCKLRNAILTKTGFLE